MQQLNTADVIRCAREKAQLETELGRRMYEVFNSEPVIGELRGLVQPAIEQLALMATRTTDHASNKVSLGRELFEMRTALAGESPLAVWRGRGATPESLMRMAGESATWSAADCSDLIRLFVTVVEHGRKKAPGLGMTSPDVAAHHTATRPGAANWGEFRARRGAAPLTTGTHTLEGRKVALGSAKSTAATAGISRYRLEPKSTVRKIDLVFGLPEGADISGTTADSIFFMEHVGAFLTSIGAPPGVIASLGPVVQLLAPATMVAIAHHTLLETALTLTINGYMTYSIGFYTTLMPHDSLTTGISPAAGRLWEAFCWAEHHQWNHRMLCFYGGGGQGALGGYLFGAGGNGVAQLDELQKFKRLATTGQNLLGLFRNTPAMMPQDLLDDMARHYGL